MYTVISCAEILSSCIRKWQLWQIFILYHEYILVLLNKLQILCVGSVVERSPRMLKIGARSPIGIDLSRGRKWHLHCQTLGKRCECNGSSEMTIIKVGPRDSRRGTLKNPHCSMAMSAEYRSKFSALHRQWWYFQMSKKFASGTKITPNKLCSGFLYRNTGHIY